MSESKKQRSTASDHFASQASCFETTHWSVVLLAADQSTSESERALAELCQAYWMPLYAYVRCHVGDSHDAQDLTQTFFEKLLEKDFLRTVDPSKGRFRAFLLTAMKRLMANEGDKKAAQKRGGGKSRLHFDFEGADRRYQTWRRPALTPEQAFMQDWVRTLLDRVFERLRCEFDAAGKSDEFSELRTFITADDDSAGTPQVAQRMGISVGTARVAIHRLRRRYRQVLRDEVAQTIQNPDDIEDEIRNLFSAFDQS